MTVMTKADLAYAMATLLCLDLYMVKDLNRLKDETLNKMFNGYIQNAKDVNHQLEREQDRHKIAYDKLLKELESCRKKT